MLSPERLSTAVRLPALLAGVALLAAPAWGGGEPGGRVPPVSSPPPLAEAPFDCGNPEVVGQVAGVTGAVHAQAPGQPPVSLACDDVVRACDTIITSPGASIGVLSGDVFFQLGPDTRLQMGGTSDGPSAYLRSGKVRVIDTRPEGAPSWHVLTPDGTAQASGGDSQVSVGIARANAATRICSQDVGVAFEGGGRGQQVAPGECWLADAAGLRSDGASEPGIGLPGSLSCEMAGLALQDHFSPTDVAAPGFGPSFPSVGPPGGLDRQPCDIPGGTCTRATSTPGFMDPPPNTGCGGPGVVCGQPPFHDPGPTSPPGGPGVTP